MKSLMVFAKTLLTELGVWCEVDTTRDWKTVTSRVEHEGLSFLTITLADFGKSFEKSLDLGSVVPDSFSPTWGFRKGLPRFLGDFLGQVFNSSDGTLLDSPSVSAIRAIRQFSLTFAKIGVDCSDERTTHALRKFLQCEQELRISDAALHDDLRREYSSLARRLWTNVLGNVDRRLYVGDFRPKHGPGSTADGLIGNQKFSNRLWTTRLEKEFPFLENAMASWSQYRDLERVEFLEPGNEIPVKVITVPKTLKTPRIIAVEPTHMQYMQQAIHEIIVEEIRRDDFASNFLCYDDQTPNQVLARHGSRTGELATLDLSEASDRVSNEHVRLLLANHPNMFRAVDSTRSRKAHVLNEALGFNENLRLAKFASMGSALCFPMEAFVFTTLVFLGIQKSLGYHLTKKDIQSFKGRVRVYGDDIVVPVEHASDVIRTLETFGFKVNSSKSFWTGKFRESCGKDYYDGYDVSIVKVRSMFPDSKQNVDELVRTVALRNHLSAAGFDLTVRFLDDMISSMIPFPKVLAGSPILGRVDPDNVYDVDRHDRRIQRPLVKGVTATAHIPDNSIDGYDALLKYFLKRGEQPFADKDHLHRSGRSVRVTLKYCYASPY